MEMKSVTINLRGKVQNVGYRYFALNKAIELDINGFVVNLPDGSIKIEAEGLDDKIDQFVDGCRIGPPRAIIDDIEIIYSEVKNYDSFAIAYL